MATPEILLIPATPLSPSQPPFTVTPTSATSSSHTQSSGSFRTSSEDTAVTIFSMYADARENWAANTKVLALNDIDPVSRPGRPSSDYNPTSYAWRRPPDNVHHQSSDISMGPSSSSSSLRESTKPPSSFQNRPPVLLNVTDHRHSTLANPPRASDDSTFLPYTRDSMAFQDTDAVPQPISPPENSPAQLSHSSFSSIEQQQPAQTSAILSPQTDSPRPGPSPSSPSQRSDGEDPDSFHVRSTYAQLDVEGVHGDGYEEGVELTRAKEGGTTYLTSKPRVQDRAPTGDLNPREVAVLTSLDRYGFIATPSTTSDRLILLPSSSLLKPLSVVSPSSPSSSSPTPPLLPALPPTEPSNTARAKELSRTTKWARMLESGLRNGSGNVLAWHLVSRKERKLRRRIYKGIPDAWRAAAWGLLVERFSRRSHFSHEELARQYRESLDKPSTFDIQIDLDVPRTISGHVLFRTRYGHGQRSLFHVLHAFSLFCSECGYVQGMGPIAATLLCYYEPETVYTMLVHLHDAYAMHAIFSPGFPGLLESIYVQERIMERMLPDVYASFKRHLISSTSYATKWYITLFANSVPFQTQLRLWDAFFLEGRDMMVIVAVAILWVFKSQLTAAKANFETILSSLSSFFVPESEDALMRWIERALGDKKLRADMGMWREEWRVLVAEGRDRDVLL